ncbi:MAG TPA: ABC transporter permease [Terriglobales bacterium]|nr:ABC transporter permease [Terriglobales bacterium]
MRLLYKLPLRWRSLFQRRAADQDLDEEVEFHLQHQIDEFVAQGMSAEEARCAALRSLGRLQQTKEECREMRHINFLENVGQDLHFGLRMLRRSPGFTVLAVLCLTLGIGANAAVFSWIEGILLRPFPMVAGQERMMAITGTSRAEAGPTAISWPDFLDLQHNCKLFDAFIVDQIMGATLNVGDHAAVVTGSVVSANYFDALGIRPILGRAFEPEENYGRNAHPVAVISYQMWKDLFHRDPAIVGKTQKFNGQPLTIIGVAPEAFHGTFVGWAMQFWVPVSMQERFVPGGYMLEDRDAPWIEGYVLRKPGVTAQQAQSELSAVAQRLEASYPETDRGHGIKLYPLWATPFNHAGSLLPILSIALGVVVFVLLIVCANVSNLLLVKAFGRRHEMTVRLSLGARRGRLLQQLITEGLLLAGAGAIGGLILARWTRNLLVLLLPKRNGSAMFLSGAVDWRVLVLSAVACLASTLLLGLVPALQTRELDLASALKSESGGVSGGRRRALAQSSLVLIQVTLSFILLVGAGLLLKSLRAVQNTNPGFSTLDVLTTFVDTKSAGYGSQRVYSFEDDLVDRLRTMPGIQSAAFARSTPFTYRPYSAAPIAVDGYVTPPGEQPVVEYNEVSAGYLPTMGIPLLSGRDFTRADNETSLPVAILNQTIATQFFRGQDPVGRRIQVKGRWLQIVGLAKDSKYSTLIEPSKPFFYVPMRQSVPGTSLFVRTSLPPRELANALSREVHTFDANLAIGEVLTMREEIDRTTAEQQVAVAMLGAFGGLALLLAGIGLYGVMSYVVSQSKREFGLRMALGARAPDVLRNVMSRGLLLTMIGIVAGVVVALGLARLLGNLLYRISPHDPLTFTLAAVVMIIASVASCFLPAWRATQIDPVRALRD